MRMREVVFLATMLTACSKSPGEPPVSESPQGASSGSLPQPVAAASHASPVAPAGAAAANASGAAGLALHWNDPARWQKKKPSTSMRAAEYAVPHAAGDSDDAECVVITFGSGQGGGVDQNIDRWVAQFAGASDTQRSTREHSGLKITRVETTGTYTPMMMPGMQGGATPHPGWRLVGAIVEAPSGAWFFKLTGPNATVKAAAPELDAMLDSASPN